MAVTLNRILAALTEVFEKKQGTTYLVATTETKVFNKPAGLVVVSVFSKRSCPDQPFPVAELKRLIGVYGEGL